MEGERLQEVFRVFTEGGEGRFIREQLKNVYLFGSRLYGCASPDSDYDLICVVEGDYFHGSILIDNERQHKEGMYLFEVNLNLYHVDFFKSLLEKNMINALMCINLPRECVWLETYPLPACRDALRLPALKKAVIMDASHNLAKAKRLWSEGEIRISKKNLVHGLRYLHYAEQLARTGVISDFTVGNDYWKDIMDNTSDDWAVYENKYRPLYMSMMHDLKYFQDPKNTGDSQTKLTGLQLTHYLRGDDIDSLARNFSIAVNRHSRYPRLFQLVSDPVSSPLESKVVQECAYGVVLEEKESEGDDESKKEKEQVKEWGVVATSYPKIQYAIDPFTLNVNIKNPKQFNEKWEADRKSVEVFEKVDGSMAILYWYGDGWNVCSFRSPDGSEPLTRNKSLPKTTLEAWVISTTINNEKEQQEKEKKRSMLEAQKLKEEKGQHMTFAETFWDIWKRLGYQLPDDFESCYIFEMLCDAQTNIARCSSRGEKDGDLLLHGVVEVGGCKEVEDFEGIAQRHRWHSVKKYTKFESLEAVFAAADSLNPFLSEGFILRLRAEDPSGNPLRLKVRSSQWASLSLLSWFNDPRTNERQMLDYVRKSFILSERRGDRDSGEWRKVVQQAKEMEARAGDTEGNYDCGELLDYFPEWEDLLWEMKDRFEEFVIYIILQHDRVTLETAGDKKQFAKAAKALPSFAAVLFEFRDKQITRIRAYFSHCQLKKLVILMGKYDALKSSQ